jgi:hypothetical protein
MNDSPEANAVTEVVCPPTKDPAVRLFIAAAALIAFGGWCLTDLREVPAAWDLKHINDVAGYLLNNWGPFVFFPAGLISLVWGILFLRRKCVADGEGIVYAYLCREKIPWDSVTELDASELAEKKILHLRYGEGKSLTLDEWKLQNFKDLVAFVEVRVPQKPSEPPEQ